MASIDDLRAAEAERLAQEAAARRQWEIDDRNRTNRDIKELDFDDDLLEEARRQAEEKGI